MLNAIESFEAENRRKSLCFSPQKYVFMKKNEQKAHLEKKSQ